MPESKTDRAHHSLEEIRNFHDCGDARGREWLDSHPDARERAEEQLKALADNRDEPGSPPQQRIPA
jgi:hypothetical protein